MTVNPKMPRAKATRAKKRGITLHDKYGWLFISLSVITLGVFMLYPIINSLYMSTIASRGMIQQYVGLGNYRRLFGDTVFLQALKNTLLFFGVQVPVMLILALIISSLLNDKSIKFRGIFRTGIFLPAVTSLVTYALLFRMMFSLDGLINTALLATGIIREPIPWLMEPFWARVTVMIALTWRWTGYNMIFYLSGMQNIPDELYEAARIDGANKLLQFTRITVPLIKPIILFTAITSTIGTLQLFDEPMSFSSGGVTAATIGPGNSLLTLSVYIYNLCFKYMPNFGYAATVAYVIVILVAVFTIIQFKLAGDRR